MFGKKMICSAAQGGVEAMKKGNRDVWVILSDIGDADVVGIVAASKGNKALENLYLYGNSIGDKGASAIATLVMSSDSLQGLSLDKNRIGNVGAISIADSMKENCVLRRLDLSINLISDNGVIAIAQALNGNDSLGYLSFYGNKDVTEKSVEALKKMLESSFVTDLNVSGTGIGEVSKEVLKALSKTPIEKRSVSARLQRLASTSVSSESISN